MPEEQPVTSQVSCPVMMTMFKWPMNQDFVFKHSETRAVEGQKNGFKMNAEQLLVHQHLLFQRDAELAFVAEKLTIPGQPAMHYPAVFTRCLGSAH
jgi:hypothetical protein